MKDYEKAIESANIGVDLCKQVQEEDLEIKRSVNNARRDLLNILVRSTVKLDPSKKVSELRKEYAQTHELDETFMPRAQDILNIVKETVAKQMAAR